MNEELQDQLIKKYPHAPCRKHAINGYLIKVIIDTHGIIGILLINLYY